MTKIAIIGAGMAGLTAAQRLAAHADVHIFDKSRGVGGRMSTRYAGEYEFDHGAQYFTAKDARFRDIVETAIMQGHVAPWPARAFYKKGTVFEPDTGGDRFVATPRMNSWLKARAESLDITLGVRILSLTGQTGDWILNFEDGQTTRGFSHVICAVPSVQATDVLPPEFAHHADITATKMDACFALMIGLDTSLDLPWDTLRVSDLPISWLAVNSTKPGRGPATTLMIHCEANWSNRHADADRDWVQSVIEGAASDLVGVNLRKAPHRVLHRWLYASVLKSPQMDCLYDENLGLVACGDWCHGGRVEGAYLSGLAAAEALLSR